MDSILVGFTAGDSVGVVLEGGGVPVVVSVTVVELAEDEAGGKDVVFLLVAEMFVGFAVLVACVMVDVPVLADVGTSDDVVVAVSDVDVSETVYEVVIVVSGTVFEVVEDKELGRKVAFSLVLDICFVLVDTTVIVTFGLVEVSVLADVAASEAVVPVTDVEVDVEI